MESVTLISPSDGEILDAVQAARDAEDVAKGAVQHLIVAIVKAGQKLNYKKLELDHGAWMPWLKENLPISHDTAMRWIKLAKFVETKSGDIEDAKSVTEAYRLAGILPEPEPSPIKPTMPDGCLAILNRIETRIEETLGQIQPAEREQLCDRLRRLIQRLEAETSQA